MLRACSFRRFGRRTALLGWLCCLIAAGIQAALPIVHPGHAAPHAAELGSADRHTARADAPAPGEPSLHSLSGAGHEKAACELCHVIGMARAASADSLRPAIVLPLPEEPAGGASDVTWRSRHVRSSIIPRGPPAQA